VGTADCLPAVFCHSERQGFQGRLAIHLASRQGRGGGGVGWLDGCFGLPLADRHDRGKWAIK
jgi:hypothetical protein